MQVCLLVVGIVGTWCYVDASHAGQCIDHGMVSHCMADVDQLYGLLSWYDPALGGINCQEPCHLLGDGTPVEQSYGVMMACPLGLYGRSFSFDGVGTFQCRDHGGDVNVRYERRYTSDRGFVDDWFVVFDLSMRDDNFPHAYDLVNIEIVE